MKWLSKYGAYFELNDPIECLLAVISRCCVPQENETNGSPAGRLFGEKRPKEVSNTPYPKMEWQGSLSHCAPKRVSAAPHLLKERVALHKAKTSPSPKGKVIVFHPSIFTLHLLLVSGRVVNLLKIFVYFCFRGVFNGFGSVTSGISKRGKPCVLRERSTSGFPGDVFLSSGLVRRWRSRKNRRKWPRPRRNVWRRSGCFPYGVISPRVRGETTPVTHL